MSTKTLPTPQSPSPPSRPTTPHQTDRPVGQLDIPPPPNHIPIPRTNSNSSVSSTASSAPRSSSFTRNKRFLNAENLSIREELGLLDEPYSPRPSSNSLPRFDLARAALSTLLQPEPSSPPPPPRHRLSEHGPRSSFPKPPPNAPPPIPKLTPSSAPNTPSRFKSRSQPITPSRPSPTSEASPHPTNSPSTLPSPNTVARLMAIFSGDELPENHSPVPVVRRLDDDAPSPVFMNMSGSVPKSLSVPSPDDLAFDDIADAVVKETNMLPEPSSVDPVQIVPRSVGAAADLSFSDPAGLITESAQRAHVEAKEPSSSESSPISDIENVRMDPVSVKKKESAVVSDKPISKALRERMANLHEDASPAAKKENARRRMELYKRFKTIQQNAKFEIPPKNMSSNQQAVQGNKQTGSSTGPVKASSKRSTDNVVSSETGPSQPNDIRSRKIETIPAPDPSSEDAASFTSANEEFANPDIHFSNKLKNTENLQTPEKPRPRSPYPSLPVESVTSSSSASRGDRYCAHPGTSADTNIPSCSALDASIVTETSRPVAQYGLPLPLPHMRAVRGVTAHAFMDGPYAEPVKEDGMDGRYCRLDSHTAFLQTFAEPSPKEPEFVQPEKQKGREQADTAGDELPGGIRKTKSGLSRGLAKAKGAGQEIVSRAKKFPRGASLSRLRSSSANVDVEGKKFGRSKTVSGRGSDKIGDAEEVGNVQGTNDLTGAKEKASPVKVVEKKRQVDNISGIVGTGAGTTDGSRDGGTAAVSSGARPDHESGADDRRAQCDGTKSEPAVRVLKMTKNEVKATCSGGVPTEKNVAVLDYVTVQRKIRRVNEDGSVELITKKVRVRPERVLPNGDVVVRRAVKREKADGSGYENVSDMQVIRRHRDEKKWTASGHSKPETNPSDSTSMPQSFGCNRDETTTKANAADVPQTGAEQAGVTDAERSASVPEKRGPISTPEGKRTKKVGLSKAEPDKSEGEGESTTKRKGSFWPLRMPRGLSFHNRKVEKVS